jgi:His/Glu/Gln/Arg/opine family amino acid ABC transporter permease subunit
MIDLVVIKNALPQLLHGALVSLLIAFFAALIGFIGGSLLGIAQLGKSGILRALVSAYVTIIRGTPMLIQIMFLYILVLQLGLPLSKFAVAVLAIGFNSSAYLSQIVRAGIQSVPKGQIEAAYTLGINKTDLLRFIILPQALQVILPALGNELITLIKDSSLASIIGVTELYMEGTIVKNQTYDALSVYTAVALIYLCMTSVLSYFVHRLENYFKPYARN